jgi:uncharacterized protein YjbI with pentapeptide repeats
MKNYDLSGATNINNISYADLSFSNLSGVNFRYICSRYWYGNCVASYTNTGWIDHANLSHANLSGTVAPNAGYLNSDLSFSNLSGANLGEMLLRVNLSGANIQGVAWPKKIEYVKACNLGGQPDSAWSNLLPERWRYISGCLVGPTADISEGDFRGSNLSGSDLNNATMQNVDVRGVSLNGSVLSGVDLSGAKLEGADFKGAFLRSIRSGGITGTPVNLAKDWKVIGGYLVGPTAVLKSASLPASDLKGMNLDYADLTEANLSGSDLSGASLSGTKLASANLEGATGRNITGSPESLPDGWSIDTEGTLVGPSVPPTETQAVVLTDVQISGEASIGSTLQVTSAVLPANAQISYQWFRNGTAIDAAGQNSYKVTQEDFGKAISVRATAAKENYLPAVLDSIAVTVDKLARFEPLSNVAMSGASVAAEKLNVSYTNKTAGSQIKIEISHDGTSWLEATQGFTPSISDLGLALYVRITQSGVGYENQVLVQRLPDIAAAIPNSPCVAAPVATSGFISAPSIAGLPKYLNRLTGSIGAWPKGTKICYFWMKDDVVQTSAATLNYSVGAQDVGSNLKLGVVATNTSGKSVTVYSQSVLIGKQTFVPASAPKITGVTKVGQLLKARIGTSWGQYVNYSYEWLRNGVSIQTSTDASYNLAAADLGSTISVRACGRKDNYETLCLLSELTPAVEIGILARLPLVKIVGSPFRPGTPINIAASAWPVGTSVSYQWLRDGEQIIGQDTASYLLTLGDVAKSIQGRVMVQKEGYAPAYATSSAKRVNSR